jgi:hypothetical protein
VKLAVDANWDRRAQILKVQRGELQLDGAVVALTGQVSELSQSVKTELTGSTRIDFDRLSPRLASLLGPSVRIRGQMEKPLSLRGPLRSGASVQPSDTRLVSRDTSVSSWKISDSLQATAGLGWQSAQAWGFELAPGSIDARLEGQSLKIVPVDLSVSGGQLHLSPQIRLQHPMVMTLNPGALIDQVAITPTMCHSWIKYVAPLLADATAAEGRFSVRLARAEVPLQDISRANIEGSLAIHTAQVGPGPLAQEFLTLAQQIRTLLDSQSGAAQSLNGRTSWITLPDQRVSFRVADGRVAHQDLQMQVGEVNIRTRGWVGFNQQLSMVAEVPIQDDWVAQRRWLAGLRGQKLQIPISGSLQRPYLDRRVLQNLSRDTLRGAAEGMIQQELQRQLEKLLPAR